MSYSYMVNDMHCYGEQLRCLLWFLSLIVFVNARNR